MSATTCDRSATPTRRTVATAAALGVLSASTASPRRPAFTAWPSRGLCVAAIRSSSSSRRCASESPRDFASAAASAAASGPSSGPRVAGLCTPQPHSLMTESLANPWDDRCSAAWVDQRTAVKRGAASTIWTTCTNRRPPLRSPS